MIALVDMPRDADEPCALALTGLGLDRAEPDTLAIQSAVEAALPRAVVWDAWIDLPGWPRWSATHRAASWVGPAGWAVGATARFELDLGFPLGRVEQLAVVDRFARGRLVGWRSNSGEVAVASVWRFDDLPAGVHVRMALVWHGPPMRALAPMVAAEWQRSADQSVRRLVALVAPRGHASDGDGW